MARTYPGQRNVPRGGSVDEWVETRFQREMDRVIDRLVGEAGPPADADKATRKKAIELWGTRDGRFDRDTFLHALTTTGLPPEDVQEMLLVQEHPEMGPALTQPIADPETAAMFADLAEWPFRHRLYSGIEDPHEKVKYANRMQAEWQRSLGMPQMVEQADG